MITFERISVGESYDRPTLARMWGYRSYNAISRGVVTPADQKLIVFFITKEKQQSLTQYEDHIEQDILFWEGEKKHGTDNRIIAEQDEIHVYYRDRHHSDFTYEGVAELKAYRLFDHRPSKFVFRLIEKAKDTDSIVAEVQHGYGLSETERQAIVAARVGQGLYRREAMRLWQSCSVTGFTEKRLLIASHIKPWKRSNNAERIDPYNSLLLVPTIDRLFDKGYIGFDPEGRVLKSSTISEADWNRVRIDDRLKLRFLPDETSRYLEYHR